ncbi:CDP-alcohol phosphatidyltransferase family protein [Marispirochaeta sp.]|jgi:cardiolipin synthase (CMP-forming)|uniref:CDP-alcohol phosphatidyltransferase family protein n=1 Tax=Marispirochaeta sp. TaxID=2038653 RepID=UPI0029C7577A|nr:CDP-alcohol phosphatidyltransferase family protein [Marispirochaeta sp.]
MEKKIVNVPNALSLSRLVLLPVLVLFVLAEWRMVFLVSYIIIGSTDFFDGWVARTFNQKTEFGKKLDSFVDIFFYVGSAWFMYRLHMEYLEPNMPLLKIFFGLFVLSFVVSAIFCGKPIMMHTFLLRLNGVLVYSLIILSGFIDTRYFITLIFFIYLIGFIEEIIIFVRFGEVDPDSKSIFHIMVEGNPIKTQESE